MTAAAWIHSPDLQLAWSVGSDDDRLFKRVLGAALLLLLLAGVVIPYVQLPEVLPAPVAKPEQPLTQIIIEPQQLSKPEPPKPEPQPLKTQPKVKPKLKKEVPAETKPVPRLTESAREKAAKSGLLQFQDDLQSMRDSVDMSKLKGSGITQGAAAAKQLERAVITSQAKASSGGINTAALSRDVGGVALSGRETTRVESKLASTNGTNPKAIDAAELGAARSEEDIRKVMDRNQGAIFSIYNRALRSDPLLQGRVVVKIVIEPSGKLSSVALVSSGLNNPALEKKLLARMRMVQFGVQNVLRTTLNYTFDFLPF